jgi:hypothetical protein
LKASATSDVLPPQAQRIQVSRLMDLDEKKGFAKRLAGIDEQGFS